MDTVDPGYSELSYSERVSPHRSLIYSEIKYVYSEYPALMNTFCCTDSFTITGSTVTRTLCITRSAFFLKIFTFLRYTLEIRVSNVSIKTVMI